MQESTALKSKQSVGRPVTVDVHGSARSDFRIAATAQTGANHPLANTRQATNEFVFLLAPDPAIKNVGGATDLLLSSLQTYLGDEGLKAALGDEAFASCKFAIQRILETGNFEEFSYPVELSDGQHWFCARLAPGMRSAGEPGAMFLLVRDITERKQQEEDLRSIRALLTHAEELANLGSWEYSVARQSFTWSDRFYRILHLEPRREPIPLLQACQMLHAEDRDRVWQDVQTLTARGCSAENEVRFVLPDGCTRTFHSRAISIEDEGGHVICIRGVSQDVTERKCEEERLRKNEALLEQAEQIASVGSWEFDLRSRRAILSNQLFRLFGVEPGTEWSEDAYWSIMHPQDIDRARQVSDRGIAECKPYQYVSRCRLPNGQIRTHVTRGLPIAGSDGSAERVIGVLQDITEQVRAEEVLRRLSRRLMRARDEERRHTARELHESAGQSLAALKMTIARLRDALPKKNALARTLLESCVELTEGAIREVRTVSYLMHPPMLDEAGLASATRWYARGFSERSGIHVDLEIPDDIGRYSQEVETTIFRIVQESLTNVHRYSGSQMARILLNRKADRLCLEIRDQGCGITGLASTPDWHAPLGVGIAGMRERVEQLNGTLEIETAPGQGTAILVALPIEEDKPGAGS